MERAIAGREPNSWSIADLRRAKQWSSTSSHESRSFDRANPGKNTIQAGRDTAKGLVLKKLSAPDIQAVIQITRFLEQTVNQA